MTPLDPSWCDTLNLTSSAEQRDRRTRGSAILRHGVDPGHQHAARFCRAGDLGSGEVAQVNLGAPEPFAPAVLLAGPAQVEVPFAAFPVNRLFRCAVAPKYRQSHRVDQFGAPMMGDGQASFGP